MKYIFLLFLLLVLTKKSIFLGFKFYTYLCCILVILSIVNVLGVYFHWWWGLKETNIMQGIETSRVIWVSWSGYDGMARVFQDIPTLFRIQSYSIESAGFALALLPAIYWAVFTNKNILVPFILMLGLCATWSLGAVLSLMIVVTLLVCIRPHFYKEKAILLALGVMLFFGGHWLVSSSIGESTIGELTIGESTIDKSTINKLGESTIGDRRSSMNQRLSEFMDVYAFLKQKPTGAGAGAGRAATHSYLSVGFLNAFADAGILGGMFYLIAWMVLVANIIACLWKNRMCKSLDNAAIYAIGLSVLTCIFFGLQREQPDASFWHMWILGSFIILSKRIR